MFTCYGFQKNDKHHFDRFDSNNDNLTFYNATIDKEDQFGLNEFYKMIKMVQPTCIFIYNDALVTTSFLQIVSKHKPKDCVVITYLDITQHGVKNDFQNVINDNSDQVLVFSNCWKSELTLVTKPISVLPHGANIPKMDKMTARNSIGIKYEGPILLNLNKNQPRKRLDLTIMALVKYYSQNPESDLLTIIGSAKEGAWNLSQIIEQECKLQNVERDISSMFTFVNNPTYLDDTVINALYNACDIGLNTCDGEGFGLCNAEHAFIGRPQIVPDLPIFRDVLGDFGNYVPAVNSYYSDSSRDSLGGRCSVGSVDGFADEIKKCVEKGIFYYESLEKHMQQYDWNKIIDSIDFLK
jgi:hypothetical protein